ncbi:MAG: DUF928 domain-containing protein [Usitatibacter sp.]
MTLHALAQDQGKTPDSRQPPAKGDAKVSAVEYKAPPKGAPRGRIGGGTRGLSRELSMAVIAPDHTGWSATAEPDFYWYVSQPVGVGPEFTILEDGGIDPIVEVSLPAPTAAGLQRVSLKNLGKRLEPSKEYRWFVTLVADKMARSKDIVASGRIAFVPIVPEVATRWMALSGVAKAAAMAGDGYWYDAIAALEASGASKENAALYEGAGLHEVARYLRSRP